jgi:hypothetical protein
VNLAFAHSYGAPSGMPARRSRAFGRLERAVDPAQLDAASNQPVTLLSDNL